MVKVIVIFVPLILAVTFSTARSETAQNSNTPVIRHAFLEACSFELADSLSGNVRDISDNVPPTSVYEVQLKRKTIPGTISIIFNCKVGDPSRVCRDSVGVERDRGDWKLWYSPDNETRWPEIAHVGVVDIESVNGSGAGLLWNDTAGDEDRRVRHLSFCLTAPNGSTLVGQTNVDVVHNSRFGKRKSIQPEVMKLLRSIKFTNVGKLALPPLAK